MVECALRLQSLSGLSHRLQVYTEAEMQSIEGRADSVDSDARAGNLPLQCFHTSQSRGGNLKRTKFFFGARCEPLIPQVASARLSAA